MIEQTQAKVQVVAGVGLMATPAWAQLLTNVSLIASTIAAVCGAVLGVYGVIRIIRKHR